MAPSVKLGVHGIDGDKTRYHVVSGKASSSFWAAFPFSSRLMALNGPYLSSRPEPSMPYTRLSPCWLVLGLDPHCRVVADALEMVPFVDHGLLNPSLVFLCF